MRLKPAVAVAVAGLVPAWLASAAGQAAWTPSASVMRLYEAAKLEREVVIWGSQNRELNWIPEAFAGRFPGIEVKWTADRSAGTKIVAEFRARRHAVDVFHFSIGGMLPLHERRMLGANDWSSFGARSSDVLLDGTAGATHNLVYAVVYNDQLVSASELPDDWDDLLDPRWKGRLVASQFLLPRLLGFLALEWGEERTSRYARALIDDQDTLVTRAPREGILQRGERALAVGEFVGSALYWRSLGMPTAWGPMSVMPATQFAVAPLAQAPHPNAARLLAGWLTTDEAKDARERLRFDADVRPGSRSPLAAQLTAPGRRLLFEDTANMVERADFYERLSAIVTGQGR